MICAVSGKRNRRHESGDGQIIYEQFIITFRLHDFQLFAYATLSLVFVVYKIAIFITWNRLYCLGMLFFPVHFSLL